MKKIILITFMLMSMLNAGNETLKDGEVMVYGDGDYTWDYVLKNESSGKLVAYECSANVLYIKEGYGMGISYNPYTSKPYFCKYESKKQETAFSRKKTNKITIHYTFKEAIK